MISVLYVDDEPGLLDIGKLFLERFGDFSVSTADSASAALDILKKEKYDAIISDYQMPGTDGLEFLKRVRLLHGQVPFILFTGRGREEVVILALNIGADYYLQKGGDPKPQFAELAHTVRLAVQRRQAEISLEESERRYREVVETQTEFISRFREDGIHVFANEAYCRHFKKRCDEIIGHRFVPSIPDEDRDRVRSHFASFTPDHPVADIEHRVIMPDGTIRWHWWNDHALFDDIGNVIEYQSVGKDITDRKRVEEELKQSENLYRTIFTTTGAATIIIAPDTTILLANKGWEELTGVPRSDQENKLSWTVFFDKDDADRMIRYHHDRRKDPSLAPSVYESRLIDAQKKIHNCFVYVKMIPGTKNSVASLVDFTARKLVEEDLKRSENLYRATFDYTVAATVLIGPDTTMLRVNSSWEKLTGIPREAAENRMSFTQFIHKDDLERLKQYHQARRKDPAGAPTIYEFRLIDNRGGIHNCIAYAGIIAGTANSIASVYDITDRKRAEESLKESEEKFRVMAESSPVAIIVFQGNRLIYVNDYTAEISGYSKEELYSLDFWDLFHPECRERIRERGLARQRGENVPDRYEVKLVNRLGETRSAFLSAGKILLGGNTAGIATIVDITDQKKTEEALQKSEERYRSIVNDQNEMIVRFTPDGTVTFANEAYRSYFLAVLDLETVVGKNIRDLMQVKNFKEVENFLSSFTTEAPTGEMERAVTGTDGKISWQLWSIRALFDADGKPKEYQVVGRDITERKLSSAALAESESRLRSIIEATRVSVTLVNEEGKVLEWNPGAERISGIKREDALGTYVWDLTFSMTPRERRTEENRASLEKAIRRMLHTGVPVFNEPQIVEAERPDGTRIFTRQTIFVIRTDRGFRFGSVTEDITDEKHAKDALRESEERYRELADLLPQMVFEMDLDFKITYANRQALTILGFNGQDLRVGINAISFIEPSQHARVKENMRKSVKGIPYEPEEYTAMKKDGSRFPIIIQSSPIYHNNTLTGFRGVIIDISDRKTSKEALLQINEELKASNEQLTAAEEELRCLVDELGRQERALRESEAKFRSIVETSPDMIWEIDQRGRFRYISPRIQSILGFAPEELIGKPVTDMMPEEAKPSGIQELGRLFSKGGSLTPFEVPAHHRDGHNLVLEIRPSLTGTDGKREGFRGVAVDVTGRKKAEEALRLANRQLKLLGSITRHDINNQLAVLNGYVGLLQNNIPDPTYKEYFSRIMKASSQIAAMIRFTSEYEKIGTGSPVWQDLATVLDRSETGILPGQITLRNYIPAGTGVYADPLIVKVFFSLLDNSLRHGQRVTEIQVTSHRSGEDLVVVWEDNGVGIPAKDKERIFERGFGKNTGLGMFLAREILSLTGITIRETGDPGNGARFEMVVPAGMWREGGDRGTVK